jgi:hypothetical protein
VTRVLHYTLSLFAVAFMMGANCGGTPPVITILSPAHGSFTTAPDVTLTGHVAYSHAGVEVRVNGTLASFNPTDGNWSVTLPLNAGAIINPFMATVVRISDSKVVSRQRIVVHASSSVADGGFSDQGVALRLTDGGLDQLEPVVASLVDLDLATLLPPNTLVIDNYCYATFIGCLGRVDAVVEASPPPSIGSFGINIDSQVGYAFGDINLQSLFVKVRVFAVSGIGFTCHVTIQAATTQIQGDYTLEPQAGSPSDVDVAQMGGANVLFGGFSDTTNCDGFLGGVVEFFIDLLVGDIQDLMEPAFEDFLNTADGNGNTPVAGAIEQALAGIQIAGPVGTALQVNLEAPLFQVAENATGITLGSDVRVTSSIGAGPGQCQPPAGTPNLSGSYHVSEAFPSFGASTPVGGLPYHLGIAISTSAFNQLLKAQIECGLLQIELTEIDLGFGPVPLTSGVLAILIPELSSFPPETAMRVRLTPSLGPFLTGNSGPGGELGEIRVGQYLIDLFVDSPSTLKVLGGALDFRAGLNMTFDDLSGQLVVGIGSVAPADITVAVLENTIGTNETSLSLSLPFLIAGVLPELGSGLGAFPIPSFFGLSLEGVEVSRSSSFYSLFTDLAPAP